MAANMTVPRGCRPKWLRYRAAGQLREIDPAGEMMSVVTPSPRISSARALSRRCRGSSHVWWGAGQRFGLLLFGVRGVLPRLGNM
jgi:hypothetical protein